MTKAPDRIFLSPKDAELFGRKYGHPNVQQVWVGDASVEYIRADQWQPIETALGPLGPLLKEALVEAEKAMTKFPQPNYVISKFSEEAGEVTKALIHAAEGRYSTSDLVGEIVQTLAMLHRLMVEGDQVHGLRPIVDLMKETT